VARPKNLARNDLSQSIVNTPSHRGTLGEQAYASLRSAILTTRLPPGLHLSEQDLSDAIGISRTPVREAIRRLIEEGLVEVSGQLGTRIALISLPRLRQAIFVRKSIECAALASVSSISRSHAQQLEADLRSHRKALQGDLFMLSEEDDKFHRHLMEACNLELAYEAAKSVSLELTRVMFLMGVDRSYFEGVFNDHERIVDLLVRKKDVPATCALLSEHLSGFEIDAEQILRDKADFIKVE
jgi:DNA-binding GntR family transcriptional regulator